MTLDVAVVGFVRPLVGFRDSHAGQSVQGPGGGSSFGTADILRAQSDALIQAATSERVVNVCLPMSINGPRYVPSFLTLQEGSATLRVSQETVRRMIDRHELQAFRVGGQVRVGRSLHASEGDSMTQNQVQGARRRADREDGERARVSLEQ